MPPFKNGFSFLALFGELEQSSNHIRQSMLRFAFFCTTPKIAQKSFAFTFCFGFTKSSKNPAALSEFNSFSLCHAVIASKCASICVASQVKRFFAKQKMRCECKTHEAKSKFKPTKAVKIHTFILSLSAKTKKL